MRKVDDPREVRAWSAAARAAGQRVALVPTMGALHDGHLAHVARARERADLVIASVFVNPTQFSAGEDFTRYPRDVDADAAKLEGAGCDLLFAPDTSLIYPDGFQTYVVPGEAARDYEGAVRPDHFRGVCTVVAKLLNIVAPSVVTFGRKDAQQLAVLRRMIVDLDIDVQVVQIETVRDPDGLAKSSRNVYLSAEERTAALSLHRALLAARTVVAAGEEIESAISAMHAEVSPDILLDYADVVDPDTFQRCCERSGALLGIIAGRVGSTRLIDNEVLWTEGGSRAG